jgi:hypothetical protein
MPVFPGFSGIAARLLEHTVEMSGVQKVEIAEISRFFWMTQVRKSAQVELRAYPSRRV